MTTPYHRIGRNAHRLPAGYFSDAPTLSPACQTEASGHHSPHGITGVSPALDKEPAPADDTAAGWQGHSSSRAQQLHAARIIFGRQS